jgi:phosphate starvation-inducible membrane PsiE
MNHQQSTVPGFILSKAKPSGLRHLLANVLGVMENVVSVASGALLALAMIMALAGASFLLWQGAQDWSGVHAIYAIVDRLMLILMLVEILHTVRTSVRSGALSAEPFLILGLIASIRRVSVITLQASETMNGHPWSPDIEQHIHASTVELAVLGFLILVMVVAIYILRKATAANADGLV